MQPPQTEYADARRSILAMKDRLDDFPGTRLAVVGFGRIVPGSRFALFPRKPRISPWDGTRRRAPEPVGSANGKPSEKRQPVPNHARPRSLSGLIGSRIILAMLVQIVSATANAETSVVRIEEQQFHQGAGKITFAEVPRGTNNPVYPPALYHGGPNSPTVRFGGFFQGRRIASPAECPPGAAATACLTGEPTAPLTLAPDAPPAFVDWDISANAVVLGGTPRFNGAVAILFDKDVAAVGLVGGHFDAIGGTAITVYDRAGHTLGETTNQRIGFEFLGLATTDLTPRIAGLQFHLVGAEPRGFAVRDIRFGASEQVDLPPNVKPAPKKARAPILP